MLLLWMASVVVGAFLAAWMVGILLRAQPAWRDIVQVMVILLALLLMILGFLYHVQGL